MTCAIVTGGAGFIGSHLCEALLAQGDRVVCLDDLSTGLARNIAHLDGHPRFAFIRADVVCESAWTSLPAATRVFHLASPASPDDYQRTPVETIRTNVVGIFNALEFARTHTARLLLTSTSEVYGDPAVHPQPESYWGNVNPVGPRSCYDEGKRCAEALAMAHARQHGTAVRVARLFNTYGPRLRPDDGRVVSQFIVHALRGEPLPLYGNGSQTRSFCYVGDIVHGLLALMNQDRTTGPVNLGNPHEITIAALAHEVLRLTGTTAGLQVQPERTDDPRRRQPDIQLAQRLLQWRPEVGLQEGLGATIEWFRAHRAEEFPLQAEEVKQTDARGQLDGLPVP